MCASYTREWPGRAQWHPLNETTLYEKGARGSVAECPPLSTAHGSCAGATRPGFQEGLAIDVSAAARRVRAQLVQLASSPRTTCSRSAVVPLGPIGVESGLTRRTTTVSLSSLI